MRTLILDDDEIFLAVAESCLAALGASHIQKTTDPVEASDILLNDQIDLVVLDLNMPEQDGLSFLRTLAEIGYDSAIMVASGEKQSVVSSSGFIGDKLGLNVCATLNKPLDMKALARGYECAKASVLEKRKSKVPVKLVPKGKLEPVFYYQPQINLETGETIGTEALLRGIDEDGKVFGPDSILESYQAPQEKFSNTAELFELFCRDLRAMRRSGFTNRFSFNVDASNLESRDFFVLLTNTIRKYELSAEGIVIELTEACLPQNETWLLETIARLTIVGFEVSMDDFSVGASSFDILRAGAFAEVKLDANVVQKSAEDAASAKFICNVVDIGETLGVRVVAEGLETQADIARLRNMGVELGQGFLIAKPADRSLLKQAYQCEEESLEAS